MEKLLLQIERRFKTLSFETLQTAPRSYLFVNWTQPRRVQCNGRMNKQKFWIILGRFCTFCIYLFNEVYLSIEVSRVSKMRNSGKTLQSNRFCIHIQDNFAGDAGNSERTFERLLFSRESDCGYSTYSDCQKFQVYFLREIFQG